MCSIGKAVNEECSEDIPFKSWSQYNDDTKRLLILRSGCQDVETVCRFHDRKLIAFFAMTHKFCCDPYGRHNVKKLKGLREISVTTADQYPDDLRLIPGKKICVACRKLIAPLKKRPISVERVTSESERSQGDGQHVVKLEFFMEEPSTSSGIETQPLTQKLSSPSTSTSTSTYVPISNLTSKVEASTGRSSISQEKAPIPLSLAVVNSPQASIVKQQPQSPGLPQITEISWGTAVGALQTPDPSWTTEYILPTSSEEVRRPREVSQPRTRDIGVQVELITTQTKNVIHNRDWEDSLPQSQELGQLRSSGTSHQYDLISDLHVEDSPPLSRPLISQSASNKEPMKQKDVSEKNGKTERVFLVFEAMLLQLFTFCRMCFAGCSASISSSCISVVIVRTQCGNGHDLKWESRPRTKSLGFVQLLQKEVNRLRNELAEYHPSRQPRINVKKRLKTEPEFIDVLELLALPMPLTCPSRARDNRYVDS